MVQVLTPLAGATSPTSPTSPMSPVSGGAPRPGCWPPAALLDDLEVPWFAVPPDDFDRQVGAVGNRFESRWLSQTPRSKKDMTKA